MSSKKVYIHYPWHFPYRGLFAQYHYELTIVKIPQFSIKQLCSFLWWFDICKQEYRTSDYIWQVTKLPLDCRITYLWSLKTGTCRAGWGNFWNHNVKVKVDHPVLSYGLLHYLRQKLFENITNLKVFQYLIVFGQPQLSSP